MKRDLREMYEEICRTYPELLSIRNIQEILGVSRTLALKIIHTNSIPHILFGTYSYAVAKQYIINYLLRDTPGASLVPGGRELYTELFSKYPELITTRQMQSVLGIGRNRMYQMIREHDIPHTWVGERKLYIPKRPLIDYLTEKETVDEIIEVTP